MKARLAVPAAVLTACAAPAPTEEPPRSAAPPAAAAAGPPETAAYRAAVEALGDISAGQYVAGDCQSAEIPDPAYAGFNVKRCKYEGGGLIAVVYVLNPTAADVARWVAAACASIGAPEDGACARRLVGRMRASNSFIFPVAGDVLEKAADAGPGCAARYGDATVHVYFRDGVTIETERGHTCETYAITEADADAEAFKPPRQVFNVGRIAALSRADYARLSGVERPGDDEWRAIVRDSYLDALRGENYSLLDLAARLPEG
jgi:hypothetical protein